MNNNIISRRKFIQYSTLAASAITIVPRHVLGGPGYVAPSDKLNIGCVGVGGKGRVDVSGVSSENIIALCDVDEKRATAAKNRFDKNAYDAHPDARKYKDFREMLEKESDLDAVTISTPDHTHAAITMAAMKKGKHVYTQKPLTRTVAESRNITEFAKEAGIASQMGNQGHANEGPRILNELIWEGAIGNVKEVHCWTDRPIWPQGIENRPGEQPVPDTLDWDLWLGPASYRPYHSDYVPFSWRGWWDFGCGALGDMGCHIMDYPFWALELTYPSAIEGYSTKVYKETAPQASIITYQFNSGLDQSPVQLIWYDGGLKPNIPKGLQSELRLWQKGSGVLFIGEEGELVYGHHRPKPFLVRKGKEYEYDLPKQQIPRSEGHYIEWINECKGNEQRAMSNFDYAGPLNEAVLLGNVALRTGSKIEWDAKNMRITNIPEANQFLDDQCRKGWEL